jgi:hypothetical protein
LITFILALFHAFELLSAPLGAAEVADRLEALGEPDSGSKEEHENHRNLKAGIESVVRRAGADDGEDRRSEH